MRRGTLKDNRGVTLTEIIILVVVVAVFAITFIPLVTENMVANIRAKTQLAAYEAAHQKIEELRNTSFPSLTSGAFQTPDVPGGSGTVTINQDINGDGQNEQDIVKAVVQVTYPDHGQTKTVTLTTFIAQ